MNSFAGMVCLQSLGDKELLVTRALILFIAFLEDSKLLINKSSVINKMQLKNTVKSSMTYMLKILLGVSYLWSYS